MGRKDEEFNDHNCRPCLAETANGNEDLEMRTQRQASVYSSRAGHNRGLTENTVQLDRRPALQEECPPHMNSMSQQEAEVAQEDMTDRRLQEPFE